LSAPFLAVTRGWAGPSLLETILFGTFRRHPPLIRQVERSENDSVEISLSTIADSAGARTVALPPLQDLIRARVLGAERLHAVDPTVPLMSRGGTQMARLWACERNDHPFAGEAPSAALRCFSTA
jgi:hypothetical protein